MGTASVFPARFSIAFRRKVCFNKKSDTAVNACRRDAVAKGMKLEEAMDKWQTMDQLPTEYRS